MYIAIINHIYAKNDLWNIYIIYFNVTKNISILHFNAYIYYISCYYYNKMIIYNIIYRVEGTVRCVSSDFNKQHWYIVSLTRSILKIN